MKNHVTSFDVAKRAGVSRSIVSAVINNTPGIGVGKEKRQAVLDAIKELNYHVDAHARGMRTRRSRCLAAYDNFSNRFFMPILIGMKEQCAKVGYHVFLYGSGSVENDREGLINLFLQRRIDGIITKDSTSFADLNWLKEIQLKEIPFISVEGYAENNEVASILIDYYQSIVMALDYMNIQGLPHPTYIEMYNLPAYNPNYGDQQRRNAYENWMREKGSEPQIICRPHNPQLAFGKVDSWWVEWLRTQTFPLVILSNWSVGAHHIYKAAYELGIRIGQDLFVMAGDNSQEVNGFLVPSLSAVEVPYREMGMAAAERVLEYIEGSRDLSDTSSIYIPTKLMSRESC